MQLFFCVFLSGSFLFSGCALFESIQRALAQRQNSGDRPGFVSWLANNRTYTAIYYFAFSTNMSARKSMLWWDGDMCIGGNVGMLIRTSTMNMGVVVVVELE